jgi:hypothetical protein
VHRAVVRSTASQWQARSDSVRRNKRIKSNLMSIELVAATITEPQWRILGGGPATTPSERKILFFAVSGWHSGQIFNGSDVRPPPLVLAYRRNGKNGY